VTATMNRIVHAGCAVLASLAISSPVQAQLTYTATELSGSTWQYTYSITNSFLTTAVDEFTIFSPVGEYSNLKVISSPGTWNSIVVQPDPALPSAGFFDAVAVNSGLLAGKSQKGFTEQFTWLGKGTPGPQTFDIVNPKTFSTIFAGVTVRSIGAPEINPVFGGVALTVVFGCIAIVRGRSRYTQL
jgi:hypothetical protein